MTSHGLEFLDVILTAKMGYQFEFQIGTNPRSDARHLFDTPLPAGIGLIFAMESNKIAFDTDKFTMPFLSYIQSLKSEWKYSENEKKTNKDNGIDNHTCTTVVTMFKH